MAWGPELGPRTRVNITYTVVYTYHSSARKVETGPGWSWDSLANLGQSGDLQGKERPYLKGGGWCSQDDTERYPPGSAWTHANTSYPRGHMHTQHSSPDRIHHSWINNRKSQQRVQTRTLQQKSSVSFSPWFCRALEQSLHSLKLGSDTLHLSGFGNNPEERSPVIIVLQARREAGLLMFIAYYLSNVTCGLQRGCRSNGPINWQWPVPGP